MMPHCVQKNQILTYVVIKENFRLYLYTGFTLGLYKSMYLYTAPVFDLFVFGLLQEIYVCTLILPNSCAVFLLWVRGRSCPCGPADLPAAAERNSQADLHLQLPQLRRLAPQRPPELRACTALQRCQRGGADAWKHAIHQRAVRRVSGKGRAFATVCKPVVQSADQSAVCVSLPQSRSGQERTVLEFDAPLSNTLPILDVAVSDFGNGNQKFGFQVGPVCYNG